MARLFKVLGLFCIFVMCVEEDLIPTGNGDLHLMDSGIYVGDSSRSDAFCTFRKIENTDQCWDDVLTVYEDCHYNLLFTRYGDGWTGADATYSTPLPDGRIMWMFGDTFLGRVSANRMREGTPFIRNSVIIQQGDQMTTLHGGTPGAPKAFVQPGNPQNWYWPLDATVYQGKIQWLLGELGSSGSGDAWDFAYRGFDLAILDLKTLAIESIKTIVENPEISYGSCILEGPDFTYIFGIKTNGLSKTAHVARVAGASLQNPWSFFNGNTWIDQPSNHVIAQNISDQFSVIKENDVYYLITHEPYFGRRIWIMQSDSPTGPWINKRTIYCTPENTANIFTYNSFVHPELSVEGELRISYNINSFNFNDLFMNADLYRPKFIRIDNWK